MAFWSSLGVALLDIIKAPFTMNLWWQLLPVLMLWIAIEVYLDWHKNERLGWNSALGNGISLFWITVASMQPLFARSQYEPFHWGTFIALLLILCYALFVMYISFMHKLRSHLSYELAYPTIIYYLAVFSILWGHGALPMNLYVLVMAIVLFGAVFGLRWLVFWLLPDAPPSDEPITDEHHEELRSELAGTKGA